MSAKRERGEKRCCRGCGRETTADYCLRCMNGDIHKIEESRGRKHRQLTHAYSPFEMYGDEEECERDVENNYCYHGSTIRDDV